MSDITGVLQTTYNAVEAKEIVLPHRPYLGMSGMGHECARYLWLTWRWAYLKKVTPKKLRIFERGDIEEARVVRDLNNAGMFCYRVDKQGNEVPITGAIGEEQEELVHFTGHSKGHPDGRVRFVPEAPKTDHNLEIKTCANKYFTACVKNGVKEAFFNYYVQANLYMKYMGLRRTLFCITNKDTEERHYERVKYDPLLADQYHERILQILVLEQAPQGISAQPDFWKCKWCDAREVCFGIVPHERNCRTCVKAAVHDNGIWKCTAGGEYVIPEDVQRTGCSKEYVSLL